MNPTYPALGLRVTVESVVSSSTTKTSMGIFPITIVAWQVSPWWPGAQNPEYGMNE
jgi:hypothetical protein